MTTPLPDVLAAVTLGPEDRAILIYPPHMTERELDMARDQLRECGAEGRIFVAMGFEDFVVLRATKAEGSTVGQCGHWMPNVFAVEPSIKSCHLAAGHTGMHSDGEATWSEPPTPAVDNQCTMVWTGPWPGYRPCRLERGHDGECDVDETPGFGTEQS